ncbi:unnamed protein product [Lathyrus oleraceus]|uniref:B-like cyclin n=1 Tax=Pisum sativum TaxID=3888 RepID=A0A9D5ADS6_PEA|nr:cyclin-D4-2-like [Pisum sativum]KAI5404438.1 hypothetical protein KIW84_051563 [Pisum sativum]KAI5404439.1 hypothetical protein KIW84_051563 [Pisum sativum]
MAPSFDCASSLLCTEDTSVFDDAEYQGTVEVYEDSWRPSFDHRRGQDDFGGVADELPLQSEECFRLMLEKEWQQWVGEDYLNRFHFGDLDFGARNEAIDWILKVVAHFGFGPLCAYLSINYMDRFLSAYELPKGRVWTMQLLAIACLSLAAKLEETDVPMILDLQIGESKFLFEAKTIQRMELLVLSTLKWRMQSITPFSFIEYFLTKINDNDKSSLSSSISQSTKLISNTVKGIEFLEFKPSEIAAALATYVVGETQAIDASKSISTLTQYIEKERLMKCVEKIEAMSLNSVVTGKNSSASVPSVPQSPIGVLDTTLCFSYKSDDTTNGGDGPCSSSHNTSPDAKRRKLNKGCESELL